MSESTPKPQLHVSMLNTLARCGIQFQRRYGHRFGVWHEEEIRPPSVALAVGSSVHAGVEANLRSKMDKDTYLSADELSSIVSDQINGIWSAGMFFSDDEAKRVQDIYGEAKDQAISLAILHHEQIAPQIAPLAVEEPFVIKLNGYPIDLSGTKDIRTADTIRDTKTAKRSPSEDAARSLQMAMYSLSELKERGRLPSVVCLDFLVKNKTPKAVIREAVPEMSWINPLLRRVERFIEIIDAVRAGHQAFSPAQPDDWVCSLKYCGYAPDCPYWSGK